MIIRMKASVAGEKTVLGFLEDVGIPVAGRLEEVDAGGGVDDGVEAADRLPELRTQEVLLEELRGLLVIREESGELTGSTCS